MLYLQIIVLALIQGMAELLPISSSANVIVAEKRMGQEPSGPKEVFLLVMLHTGTMFAVLFYFWPRWRPLLFPPKGSGVVFASEDGGEDEGRKRLPTPFQSGRYDFLTMIVLATFCTGVVGLGLKEGIER